MQSSGTRLSGSSAGDGYVSSGFRTDHVGCRFLKFGLRITGADEYARKWRARRRILIPILFWSQYDKTIFLRSLAISCESALPCFTGGKNGIGIVDAIRIDVWSKPCTSRLATFVRALRSSSDSGIIMSPFARSRISLMRLRTGPCVSRRELYKETICSTVCTLRGTPIVFGCSTILR